MHPRRILLFLVAILIADTAFAQKGRPPNNNQPSTQMVQPPSLDERGTDKIPLTVKVLPAQGAEEKAVEEERNRQEKATIDEKIAFETQRVADYTFWLSAFTLAVFFSATVQVGLFFWQLILIKRGTQDAENAGRAAKISADATAESVELLRSNAIRELRAYVFVETADISEFRDGKQPDCTVTIKNSGKTPAYSVSHFGGFSFREFPLRQPLPTDDNSPTSTANVPSGGVVHKLLEGRVLTSEQLRLLDASEAAFYCYGEVKYVDTFSVPHFTRYRFVLGGNLGRPSKRMFIIAPEGNETDDDVKAKVA
jgi:hypothetical protein